MRTTYPLAIVLALGLMAAFFAGSGFNAIVTGEHKTEQVSDAVNDSANSSVIGDDNNLTGSRSSSGEGSIVGLVIGASGTVIDIVSMVLLLPLTLRNLGFPVWFAVPVGGFAELLLSIGFIQFVTGRQLR